MKLLFRNLLNEFLYVFNYYFNSTWIEAIIQMIFHEQSLHCRTWNVRNYLGKSDLILNNFKIFSELKRIEIRIKEYILNFQNQGAIQPISLNPYLADNWYSNMKKSQNHFWESLIHWKLSIYWKKLLINLCNKKKFIWLKLGII